MFLQTTTPFLISNGLVECVCVCVCAFVWVVCCDTATTPRKEQAVWESLKAPKLLEDLGQKNPQICENPSPTPDPGRGLARLRTIQSPARYCRRQ